jgi:hypothetical protein
MFLTKFALNSYRWELQEENVISAPKHHPKTFLSSSISSTVFPVKLEQLQERSNVQQ